MNKNNYGETSIYIQILLVIGSFLGFFAAYSLQAEATISDRYFEYQQASKYTHLKWQNSLRPPITLALAPVKNYSGIPMENRDESAEYFYHGKLPTVLNRIYADTFKASRFFEPVVDKADYKVEMILDEYKLPFQYSPDDTWWQKLHDQADRWLQVPATTHVKLTLKVTSGQKKIKPWMDSVVMVLSNCDLNASPQPATFANNRDKITTEYLSTTPGQTFLAATNFLVLQTIQRLNQEALNGRVEKVSGNHIYLTSHTANFVQGDLIDLYFNELDKGKSALSSGQLKIIQSNQDSAIAYPVSLRADHIKINDWVEIKKTVPYSRPEAYFEAANQCAPVMTAEVD